MQYFIKRGEKVQGPYTLEQVLILVESQKITAPDLVSNSAEGPFQALKTVLESINNPPAAPASSEPVQPTIETAPQTSMPVVQESFKGSAIDTGEAAPVQPALQTGLAAAVSKAKNVAQKAAKQVSDLKKSTGEQFKEGGTKEAGKHLASSLADPKFRLLASIVGIGVLLVFGGVTAAFIVQKAGSPAAVSYIPPDCVGGVRLRVQDLLDLQIMKWLPVEVAEAFGKERMGVDIHDIVEVIGLMSAPEVRSVEQYSGRSYIRYEDPDVGGIVRFSTSYELEDLFQWSEFQTREVTMEDGGEALLIRDGGLDVLFTMPDSRTLLIGTERMVRKMIENKNGRNASSFTNQFATLKDESQLALVINVEAFTPEMIEEARKEIARERLPSWVDDLVGRLFRLESGDLQIQIDSGLLVTVTARAKDHAAAVKLHESLTQALERGREMILDELDFYTGDDMLDHSLGRYASRVSKQVIDLLQFEVGGQSVVLQTELIK